MGPESEILGSLKNLKPEKIGLPVKCNRIFLKRWTSPVTLTLIGNNCKIRCSLSSFPSFYRRLHS